MRTLWRVHLFSFLLQVDLQYPQTDMIPETITCKGAVCWGPGEPLVVEDIEVEPPQAGEVRVRILYASICQTDIMFWKGYPAQLYPRILGHEGVGVIENVGEGVTNLKEGDTVIPTFIGECKECPNCKSSRTNLCLIHPIISNGLLPGEKSRMSVKGQKIYHAFTCSTFAEFTVMNANYVVKIDKRVALSDASLLSCGFSTGYGAVWKEAKAEKGSTVAVFGLGGVGLGAVVAAKVLGSSKIIGVDLNDARKEQAIELGLTDFVNPSEFDGKSVSDLIKEISGGYGVDYSIECTGAAPLLNEALKSTFPGRGCTVVVGTGSQLTTTLNVTEFYSGKSLKGSIFGGIKPQSDLNILLDKCVNKELQLKGLVTHEIELSKISTAFDMVKKPDCLKLLINISGDKKGQNIKA